jgi:hypothetical protein
MRTPFAILTLPYTTCMTTIEDEATSLRATLMSKAIAAYDSISSRLDLWSSEFAGAASRWNVALGSVFRQGNPSKWGGSRPTSHPAWVLATPVPIMVDANGGWAWVSYYEDRSIDPTSAWDGWYVSSDAAGERQKLLAMVDAIPSFVFDSASSATPSSDPATWFWAEAVREHGGIPNFCYSIRWYRSAVPASAVSIASAPSFLLTEHAWRAAFVAGLLAVRR